MKRFLISCISVSYLLVAACGNKEKNVENPEFVEVLALESIDTVLKEDFIAEIRALQNVEIRSRLKGYLEDLYVDEGKSVTKGQVLFKINDEEYRLNLSKAKAKVKNAIAAEKNALVELERTKKLAENNIVSPGELELAQSRLNAARANVEEAEAEENMAMVHLSYTLVRAPFSGSIDRILQRRGSLVDEGTLLTTISELDNVYAYFNLSEREYLELKKEFNDNNFIGQEVGLQLVDGSIYPEKGVIETMESEFESSTGNISIRAKFPNKKKILKHGSSGRIIFNRNVKDGIFVPHKAVIELQDKYYVFKVDSNNRAKMIPIVPKKRLTNVYWIQSGLQAGDIIVIEGIQKIKNNTLVTYK
ncbi:efflux RND transporter periplasmic adaptor subunit [Thermaurantimonas aggregans]|uniref:efflux RND transporter periplasmic adaptor subunit n=1 Tax=Thermaurantimonas aggregans TaxID=2173829 RepID=UPI001356E391|nr:efflux RND transporter periplasmic adaptor subunit [Thermaurantimonas aggregans]MCX8148229.1 efflux RND transporter periplasmic adaptor subunit [Thermaurantimonas aggregans]